MFRIEDAADQKAGWLELRGGRSTVRRNAVLRYKHAKNLQEKLAQLAETAFNRHCTYKRL